MSEECKYCKTSQTCLEMADYGSIYCLLHREIPRVIEKTYEELQQENQELKKKLKIKHDGFMASIDDVCEYAEENDKLRNVIDEAIYTLKDMQFQYEGLSDLDVVIKILEMEDKHE